MNYFILFQDHDEGGPTILDYEKSLKALREDTSSVDDLTKVMTSMDKDASEEKNNKSCVEPSVKRQKFIANDRSNKENDHVGIGGLIVCKKENDTINNVVQYASISRSKDHKASVQSESNAILDFGQI